MYIANTYKPDQWSCTDGTRRFSTWSTFSVFTQIWCWVRRKISFTSSTFVIAHSIPLTLLACLRFWEVLSHVPAWLCLSQHFSSGGNHSKFLCCLSCLFIILGTPSNKNSLGNVGKQKAYLSSSWDRVVALPLILPTLFIPNLYPRYVSRGIFTKMSLLKFSTWCHILIVVQLKLHA